jgi:hypothetical protein
LFTVLFVTSCLIKWQPLILAPFLLVFVVQAYTSGAWSTRAKSLLRTVVLPALLVLVPVFLLFGPPMLAALGVALTRVPHSGGYALNLNWIVIHTLGQVTSVTGPIGKGLFAVFFGLTLAAFARSKKTLENLWLLTLVGYVTYFTLSTGAHENHLFFAAVLALLLYSANQQYLYTMLFAVISANVNLFLFGGISGVQPIPRSVGIDLSLALAAVNVLWFFVLWGTTCVPWLSRHPFQPRALAARPAD